MAELQNYFEDECVAALRLRETSLDEVSQTAVVVYPVLLPDRTELLVSLPTGAGASKLQRFTVRSVLIDSPRKSEPFGKGSKTAPRAIPPACTNAL